MTMQSQAMFESPASYEANPYSNPEFENEWEQQETNPYTNSEFEWEQQEANPYSNSEFENEWEQHEAANHSQGYANPEFEDEWEQQETNHYHQGYANPEYEQEGEYFFKKIGRFLKKNVLPLAKRFAPSVVRSLTSLIPGVGAIAAPLAGKLTSAMLREGEMEASQMEAEFFGNNEFEAEIGTSEVAYEAALTEFMAAQAAEATTESEAESMIAATLPITISIMGGKRALRPVVATMAQASARRSRLLNQQGTAGKQILRAVPAMDRTAIATLKSAARAGQPINSATALKAMAAATQQVMTNPQKLQKAITQNLAVRQKTAPSSARNPMNPRRAASASCPTCAGR
ncbi:hypothetical protein ACKFKF_13930 [Phormidesmis sp. 146-12]